ncbi:MAG: DUF1616 domain-containing protein [Methanocorpusculum sp.]|nr:DUF1616 domain-containing protein [Methanocorpusculum sp.]
MADQKIEDALAEMADPKNLPKDLIVIALWLILAIATIYIPFINETFIRVIFTVPVILFIPGYVLIAALFPEKKSIDGIERFALSVGLSIAVVPLIGLVLNYTPFGIRLDPIVISLVIFTVIMMIITFYRRARIPKEEKFEVPFDKVKPTIKEEFFPKNQKPFDKVLSIILIIAIVAAVVTTVYVIAFPKDGEKFTEFFVLGEKKMADDYPEKFAAGSEQFVWIGINNHEYRNVTYTVDVLLMNAEWNNVTNSSVINSYEPLDRFEVMLANDEEYLEMYNFSVASTQYNRLEFLLYNETVPYYYASAEEKIASAYRDLHLWIKVV